MPALVLFVWYINISFVSWRDKIQFLCSTEMATPSRALVQIIGAHKPFKTSMCIEQTISLMKMFKVEFPEVTKMNVKNSMHFKQGGFRYAKVFY